MRPITNPDFNAEFARWQHILSTAPDNELKHYLLSGDPIAKLAAASVQDQKLKMQAQAQPAAQAPTQSVLAQKADMVQPGVAALPVAEGMFSENSYAGGGIVSFDEGGDVPSYAPGGDTSSWYERQIANPISDAFSGINAYRDRQGKLGELRMQRQKLSQGLGIGPGMNIFTQESDPQRQERLGQIAAIDQQIEALSSGSAPAVKPAASTIKGVAGLNKDDVAKVGADAAKNYESDQGDPNKNKGTGANTSGIGALSWTKLEPNTAGFNALQQTEQTPQQLMAERNALIGPDENRQAIKDKLAAMEANTDKREAQASGLSLAQFGFGLASARQGQEFDTLSKSAINALDSLATAKDKVQTAREKQFELSSRISQADRAEKVAAADYGLNSAKHTKAENRAVKLAELNHNNDIELKNAEAALNVQKGNAEIKLAQAKMGQDAAQHKQTIEMYDKRIAASGGAAQARLVETKRKAYLDAQTTLGPEIARILKTKYNSNSDDPMFQRERDMMLKGYVANALSVTLDDMDARDSSSF